MFLPRFLETRLQQLGAAASLLIPPPPALPWLTSIQCEARERILERHRERILAVKQSYLASVDDDLSRGEVTADLARLADELVAELRAMTATAMNGTLVGEMARLDSRLQVDAPEFMDRPDFDEASRVKLMDTLDRRTHRAGGYVHFLYALAPLLRDNRAPVTVLDLASGNAGFPIALAQLTRQERRLRIIASDIRPEYLEMGQRHAQMAGVDDVIEFRVVDALNIGRTVGPGEVDIVTCTQSLHHFGAGGVATVAAEAIRLATRGVVFVDLLRSLSRLLMISSDAATSFNWSYFHDAVVSVRKSFLPEELRLVAECTPGGETLESFYLHPAFVVLRTADAQSRDTG